MEIKTARIVTVWQNEVKIGESILEERKIPLFAEPETAKYGKWTQICDISHWQYTDKHYMCSECSETTAYKSSYCPRCGTRMDLENDDD